MGKPLKFIEEKQNEFLTEFSKNLSIRQSADYIDMNYTTVMEFIKRTPHFKKKMADLRSNITNGITEKVIEMALNGNVRMLIRILDSKLFKDSELCLDKDTAPSIDISNLVLRLTNKTYDPVNTIDYKEGDDDL